MSTFLHTQDLRRILFSARRLAITSGGVVGFVSGDDDAIWAVVDMCDSLEATWSDRSSDTLSVFTVARSAFAKNSCSIWSLRSKKIKNHSPYAILAYTQSMIEFYILIWVMREIIYISKSRNYKVIYLLHTFFFHEFQYLIQ